MTDAEHVSQARARAAPADPGETPLARLESRSSRNPLATRWGRPARRRPVRDAPVLLLPRSSVLRAEIGGFRLGADGRPLSEAQDARRSPHPRQRPARASALQPT